MKTIHAAFCLLAAPVLGAPIHSGHASAELLVASTGFEASRPVEAAIRIVVDPGWHTYWTNPGEGGMKLGAEWVLPEGWSAGPLGWPVPIRFKTGDLPGFGYVGEVVIPVTLTPPAGAAKAAKVSVKLDWLTCDESACVSGDAQPSIELTPGSTVAGQSAAVIEKARTLVPQPIDGLQLEVTDSGKAGLELVLKGPAELDLAACSVFPATPQVVDPGVPIRFTRSGDHWRAAVSKSEYLEGAPKALELVLSGGGLSRPALVSWTKK